MAVKAFNRLKLPLKIVGTGQDEAYCKSIAEGNIEFHGKLSNNKLLKLYQRARALIFPGEDDFGITPLEAQACNTPVIAYASGGALETVTNQTGIFFGDQKEEKLCNAVQEMERTWKNFSPEAFSNQTKLFQRETYKEKMATVIQNGFREWQR